MRTLISIIKFVATALACSNQLTPQNGSPVVAAGYQAQLVAQGLTGARSILFDSSGRLIVLLGGSGIVGLDLDDRGGTCLSVTQTHVLVNDTSVSRYTINTSNPKLTIFGSSTMDSKYLPMGRQSMLPRHRQLSLGHMTPTRYL